MAHVVKDCQAKCIHEQTSNASHAWRKDAKIYGSHKKISDGSKSAYVNT